MRRATLNGIRRRALQGLLLSFALWRSCLGADGPASRQDVQVIGRVLKFQENRRGDALTIAVLYDPANPASAQEAASMARAVGTGQAVGSLTLNAILIEQNKADTLADIDAVFAATGTNTSQVEKVVRQHGVPCLTRDIEQVAHGPCTVAIQTSPSIAIFFSSDNAAAAGVRFATAFVMMVHEL